MSIENSLTFYKKGDEEIFNRINKKHDNLYNLRKKKFFQKSELINSINDYAQTMNNFHFLLKKKENKKLESFTNNKITNYSSFRKPNYNIEKSKGKIDFESEKLEKEKAFQPRKSKLPHLIIDSYNKKVKFTIPNDMQPNINKTVNNENNNTKESIIVSKEEHKNDENNNYSKRDIKLNMNNSFHRKRAKSAVGIDDIYERKKSYCLLPSQFNKKRKQSQIISERINPINIALELNSKKKKSKNETKKKSTYNNIKYSNNFVKDCILKTILNNQNLKILYQTDEIRIKKMIRSQNKKNKKKFTIFNYQNNLIKNSISPLNEEQKFKIMKSFSKINRYAQSEKKINLHKYLKDIQKKEKIIITSNNVLNENCVNNIKKIGISKDRHLLKYEKVIFKDIFKKKK